jgi:hypothetical protein
MPKEDNSKNISETQRIKIENKIFNYDNRKINLIRKERNQSLELSQEITSYMDIDSQSKDNFLGKDGKTK